MQRIRRLLLVFILTLVSGCIWTEPGPTYTPWPTLTPPLAAVPMETPTPDMTRKETNSMNSSSVTMPTEPTERNQMFDSPPPTILDPDRSYAATIETTKGKISCELYADQAPQTVNNFVYLARAGFYDGLTFHRVVPGFVIQGGDPLGNGTGGPGYTVPAEIGLSHNKGALATARLADQANPRRESSGSQFYITLDKTSHLDGAYTVFGQVVDGMAVVESIAAGDVIVQVTVSEE